MTGLVVYRKELCSKCENTIRWGENKGLNIEVRQIFDENGEMNEDVAEIIHQTEMRTAPIVVAVKDDNPVEYWCDFRIDKITHYSRQFKE